MDEKEDPMDKKSVLSVVVVAGLLVTGEGKVDVVDLDRQGRALTVEAVLPQHDHTHQEHDAFAGRDLRHEMSIATASMVAFVHQRGRRGSSRS